MEEGSARVKPLQEMFFENRCKQSDASDARGREPTVLAAVADDKALDVMQSHCSGDDTIASVDTLGHDQKVEYG